MMSCFSSNDGKKSTIWLDEENRPIRPRIMVSEFLCECHGPLKLTTVQLALFPNIAAESVMTIKPGKNTDGYWTNSDLVAQFENAIQIFQILHPDSDAVPRML
jgi:hypothetical protein